MTPRFLHLAAIAIASITAIPNTISAKELTPQTRSQILDIKDVKSASGIKAWLVEDHSMPIIAINFAFKDAGTKNDPADKQGLIRMLSNTMDEGAGDLDSEAFQKALRNNSISLSFSAGRDHFNGRLKTLTQNKEIAFTLLKTALTNPRFDEDPVNRMRASNKSRIKSSLSKPKWIAERIQNNKIFKGHPYAQNSGGTLTSLDAITPEDLRAAHKTLNKDSLIIGITGDITEKETRVLLDDLFNAMPQSALPKPHAKKHALQNFGKTYLYKMDTPQTVIEISQKGISRSDDAYHATQVMNFILGQSGFGSRLMEEIREKRGLTYGIYSYFREYEDANALHISTSTKNKNVPEMLSLINTEWNKMTKQDVSAPELKDAKSYLVGSLPLSLTSTDDIAGMLLSLQLDSLPKNYLDIRQETIKSVTQQDIRAAAQKLLDKKSFTTILVGQPKNIENTIEVKTLPYVQ